MFGAIRDFFRAFRSVRPAKAVATGTGLPDLREGEYDPELNKLVRKIIIQTDGFAIYVDSNYDVQFLINTEVHVAAFTKVQTQVTFLEQTSTFLNGEPEALLRVRSLLGEAYSRVLLTGNSEDAEEALILARSVLAQKNSDVSYGWYFQSALVTCSVLVAGGFALWFSRYRPCVTTYLGRSGLELLLCAIAGALGALFSISSRAGRLTLNALAGKRTHELEAHSRLFAGMLSASLFVMALKSKLVLAPLGEGNGHLTTLLLLSTLAGITERVIPSLVSRFEDSVQKSERVLENHSSSAHVTTERKLSTARPPKEASKSAPASNANPSDSPDENKQPERDRDTQETADSD